MEINIRGYGAAGDGVTDDTAAIRAAVEACPAGGEVYVPEGVFACAELRLKPHMTLRGSRTWGYRDGPETASCLIPSRAEASCLLDITDAVGSTLTGLSLCGRGLGTAMHGVRIAKAQGYGREEDAVRIEGCRVADFSGDALHLAHVWCATVRDNMLSGSRHGVYIDGWDLFLYDNWMTANRIEWCGTGALLEGVSEHTAEGNYFDRCTVGGIRAVGGGGLRLCGNINQRNGVTKGTDESCNVYLDGVTGAEYRGNVMEAIRGDGADTNVSPEYAMILRGLRNSRIVGNTAYKGYVAQLLLDYGGHRDTEIAGNPGTVYAR